jgi:hypothetical protein
VTINSTDQVGRYTLYQRLGSREPVGRTFYVDLFGETEADTAPRERAAWPATLSLDGFPAQPAPGIWMPLVAVCLGLLAVEWFHFIRRG